MPDTVLLTQEKWFRAAYWVSNPTYAAGNGQPQLIVANNVGLSDDNAGGIINASPAGGAGPGVTPAAANALRGIQFTGAGVPPIVNFGNITMGSLSNGGSLTPKEIPNTLAAPLPAPQPLYLLRLRPLQADGHHPGFGSAELGYFTGKGTASLRADGAIKSDNAYIPASVASAMQNGGITSFTLGTLNANNNNLNNATGSNYWTGSGISWGRYVLSTDAISSAASLPWTARSAMTGRGMPISSIRRFATLPVF